MDAVKVRVLTAKVDAAVRADRRIGNAVGDRKRPLDFPSRTHGYHYAAALPAEASLVDRSVTADAGRVGVRSDRGFPKDYSRRTYCIEIAVLCRQIQGVFRTNSWAGPTWIRSLENPLLTAVRIDRIEVRVV